MRAHWSLLVLPALALAATTASHAQNHVAKRAQALIAGLDFDEARSELAAADLQDPELAIERARLAIDELDCDGAAAILARTEVQNAEGGDQLTDMAHGCQRVTAALVVDKDEHRGIEVRWQDEHDRSLAPLLFETVAKARDAISRDLGVDWPRPTRIVVVRDLLSLSAMTGLPYQSAQTTGTVAVAKWGRVTLLSPRASHHGYAWRDTVAHELTHLAVTRASRDTAPLWLQEGVAKREEVRWRAPGPFDDRPSPDTVVRRGQELGLGLPLDRLGPSIAMLPSADAAMVAFAEVTSFVEFFVRTQGDEALPALLRELRRGKGPDAALVAASGIDLKGWDARWSASLAARPRDPLPALFGLRAPPGAGHHADGGLRDLRDRSHLAELLLSRGHAAEALKELDGIHGEAAESDPSLLWLRCRALEDAGRRAEGEASVADPKQVFSSYGPWWATRGRWARLRGEEGSATESFAEALGADPLDVEVACESIDPGGLPSDPLKKPLCEAARARQQPPFEGD